MPEPESLCPGYKQVDGFGSDEDYEDEGEVLYVTLDLGAAVEPTLIASSSTYRLIGLDTPTPFLQLSGTIFKGQHDTLLGTELLFTEQKDEVDRSKRFLNPAGTTEQRIRFKEIQLRPKTKNPSDLFAEADATSNAANLADSGGDNSQTTSIVDRMTGKTVPVASRKGKKIGDRQVKSSRKRKGKEKEDNADNEMEGENVTVDQPESANEEPMNLAEG